MRVLTQGEGSYDMPGPSSLIPRGVPATEGQYPGVEGRPQGQRRRCGSVWNPSFLVCEAGRPPLMWTRVCRVDGGQQCGQGSVCGWGSAVWMGVCRVDGGQVCGQGLPC